MELLDASCPHELLIIDAEPLADELVVGLAAEGFHILRARSGEEGVAMASSLDPAAVIVRSRLPDLSGLAVLRLLASTGERPVLFLSGSDDEDEVVLALEMGAADFLGHPLRIRECAARIWSAIRRFPIHSVPVQHSIPAVPASPPRIERAGPVEVNLTRREVTIRGHLVHARPKEIDLLALLVSNAGRVVSREQELQTVWTRKVDRGDSLDVHIRRIRGMVEEDLHRPRHVITVRGYGHRFDP